MKTDAKLKALLLKAVAAVYDGKLSAKDRAQLAAVHPDLVGSRAWWIVHACLSATA